MNHRNRTSLCRAPYLGIVGALLLAGCAAEPSGSGEITSESEHALGSIQISGRVTSPTGTPISGVKMTLSGAASKITTTNAAGQYTFTQLSPGAYTLVPSKSGLKFCTTSASLPKLRNDITEDFGGSSTGCQAPTHQRKATVLIYDPIFTRPDGTTARLSQYNNWEDPVQLADRYRRSLESITNGRVKYTVVKTKIVNDIPAKLDGFDYDQQSYLACLADPEACHSVDTPDIASIIDSQGVCSDLNAGTTDELWLFGGPYFGFWESQLAGPRAFTYNSPPIDGSSCNKLLPIHGGNYETNLGNMVHNLMHRTEATMSRVYGSWHMDQLFHNFDRFGLVDVQSPFPYSGCGSAHYAPNSTSEYEYDNPNPVSSYCDDFFNYPNLKPPQQALKTITCSTWGCDELGYYRWFFQHMPKASGRGPDAKFNDWWRYLVKPNDIFLTDLATCSSEYGTDWCQHVLDGNYGTCNEYEWATNTLPTGWVKVTWPAARSVSSIKLFDRACDEQVLAGHLEFSNGSPNIPFGATGEHRHHPDHDHVSDQEPHLGQGRDRSERGRKPRSGRGALSVTRKLETRIDKPGGPLTTGVRPFY